ncbi:MAG: transporter [Geobacteraceae bacterium]|nr:transporter [Geobacteraceae bacterium]
MIAGCWKYVSTALFLAMTCPQTVVALTITPDKPKTASISLGAEFASGTYGSDTTTRSVYMPLIVTWSPNDRFDVGIEVPYIYQSSSRATTSLFNNNLSSATAVSAAQGGPAGNGAARQQQQPRFSLASGSSSSAVSGVGDIIMRLGVIALAGSASVPQVRPSLYVKFPTAKASDGLGTGEFDGGIGLDANKWFGNLHLTGETLYTWQGKVDGLGLKNYLSYTAGIGYLLMESVEPMFIVKGATAPSDYAGALLEARARLVWSVTASTALDLYGSRGIADSSPDYGGGLSVVYSF